MNQHATMQAGNAVHTTLERTFGVDVEKEMEKITMTNSISDRINALKIEADEDGDQELIAMCNRAIGRELRDSDSAETLSVDQLGGTVGYVRAVCESLDCPQIEGHVRVEAHWTDDSGRVRTSRLVYAR